MRPWQPELQRLCCHFVFESDELTDPKLQFRNPGKQAVQVSAGRAVQPLPFTHRLLTLKGWARGTRLCVWEGAALLK